MERVSELDCYWLARAWGLWKAGDAADGSHG